MNKIALTQSRVALIDAVDYDDLSARPWCYDASTGYAKSASITAAGKRTTVYMHKLIARKYRGEFALLNTMSAT